MTRLGSDGATRLPRTSHRGVSGRVPISGGSVAVESSLERDWVIALDFDPRVTHVQEQPFTLTYLLDGAQRRYTPDVLATFEDQGRRWQEVYEVKSRDDLRANWNAYKPRFRLTYRYCKQFGARFRIITEREIRTPYVENAKFLRRYRDIPEQPLHRQALLFTLKALGPTTPQALIAATWREPEKQMAAIAELWRLMANRRTIQGCLALEPLTMKTEIWFDSP